MKTFKEFYHKYDYTIKANFILETIIQTILMIIFMVAIVLIGHDDVNASSTTISVPKKGTAYYYNELPNFSYVDNLAYSSWSGKNPTGQDVSLYTLSNIANSSISSYNNYNKMIQIFDYQFIKGHDYTLNLYRQFQDNFIGFSIDNWSNGPNSSYSISTNSAINEYGFNCYVDSVNITSIEVTNPVLYFFYSKGNATYSIYYIEIIDNGVNYEKKNFEQNEEAEKTRKGILQTIIDLPKTIANLFIDMLKSLFIPTEEQMQDILDKSSDLASNFGFIGQSVDFMISLINSLIQAEQGRGCIDLPELTLEFSKSSLDMNDFTVWHEQNICLADHAWIGDTKIITPIRTLLTGSLVILFLRFAIREFGFILSKENSNYESGDDKE